METSIINIQKRHLNYGEVFYFLSFFIFFFVFFSILHPLYVFDTDDWINMGLLRSVFPTTDAYNPIKVLPEVLFPVVSMFGARFIYPLTEDYIGSLCLAHAIIYSAVILCNALCVKKFIEYVKATLFDCKNKEDSIVIYCLLSIFFCCLFYFGRNGNYLLRENDVTCIYHYSIPSILNFSVVLFLILSENRNRQILCFDNSYLNVLWSLVLYLCIYSNLFISSILLAYVIFVLLKRLFPVVLSGFSIIKIKQFFLHGYQFIAIVFIWGISVYFEAKGQRALEINHNFTLASFYDSLSFFLKETVCSVSFGKFSFISFLFLISANLILLVRYILKTYNAYDRKFLVMQLLFLWMVFFIALYHIMLTVKTGVGYQVRPSMVYCWFVWILLEFVCCFIYLSLYFSKLNAFIPVVLLVLLYRVSVHEPTFKDLSYFQSENPASVKLWGNYLVKTLKLADKEGLKELILCVPKFKSEDNFPLAIYANEALADTVYLQGITRNLLKIVIVPDKEISSRFFVNQD